MQTSKDGQAFIAKPEHEGRVMKVYPDPVGLPTGGIGHLLSDEERDEMPLHSPLTDEQVDEWFREDVSEAERAIEYYVRVVLSQPQFDALVSLVFNIGVNNFKSSTLLKKLNAGDMSGAAAQFERWIYAKGKVLPGLVKRRKAERHLFEKGEYDG